LIKGFASPSLKQDCINNKALLEQWKERLETFLKIDETIEEPAAKRGRKKNSSVIGCLYPF